MLIHSVMPVAFLSDQPELPQFVWKKTDFGHVEGYYTAEGFRVSRIHTTDPRQYLNKTYTPGAILR